MKDATPPNWRAEAQRELELLEAIIEEYELKHGRKESTASWWRARGFRKFYRALFPKRSQHSPLDNLHHYIKALTPNEGDKVKLLITAERSHGCCYEDWVDYTIDKLGPDGHRVAYDTLGRSFVQ